MLGEARRQRAGALVVEPHPVEQRAVGGQTEQARYGIARLRDGGDGADLGEAEPERAPHVESGAVLVEARRQA